RPEPAHDVRRLRHPGDPASGRAGGAVRDPRAATLGAVRPDGGAEGMKRLAQGVVLGAAVVAAVLLPGFVSDYHALELGKVGMYFIAILGIAVLTGYSGQISL